MYQSNRPEQMINQDQLFRFNEAAITALVLYLALSAEEPHTARMLEFDLLRDWMITSEESKFLQDYYDTNSRLWFPDGVAPDICICCYQRYGYTLGGRLRDGCLSCLDNESCLTFYIYSMRDKLYINDAHVEYLFAWALHYWSTAKERPRQRTAKYLRDNDLYITEPASEVLGSNQQATGVSNA